MPNNDANVNESSPNQEIVSAIHAGLDSLENEYGRGEVLKALAEWVVEDEFLAMIASLGEGGELQPEPAK